jgi:hypothetical protein
MERKLITSLIILLMAGTIGLCLLFTGIAKANPAIEETETAEEPKTDPVYVICDVTENYDTEVAGQALTVLVCEMPNGELHQYGIIDAPEGKIDTVCFKTENQDDYSVYEVVAVDKKNFYPRSGIITEIDDDITVTCSNGNKYNFKTEVEDWMVGDICSMLILDKGTETVADDTVIDAWYDGYIELWEEIE